MAKKTVIHVNQHVIKANAKSGEDNPPLTVKTYNTNDQAYSAEIYDAEGNVVARVINRPHDPLSCGARVWIEAYHPVSIVTSRDEQGEVSDSVEPPQLPAEYSLVALTEPRWAARLAREAAACR